MNTLYDKIGLNYSNLRNPDFRIARRIEAALANATTVLNVGAGAGSYEPTDRQITAIEPSIEMIKQRPVSNTKVVQCRAEELPYGDKTFDTAMAVR